MNVKTKLSINYVQVFNLGRTQVGGRAEPYHMHNSSEWFSFSLGLGFDLHPIINSEPDPVDHLIIVMLTF